MSIDIRDLVDSAYGGATEHGFWGKQAVGDKSNIPEKLMLIVSELGEACEALRHNKHAKLDKYRKSQKIIKGRMEYHFNKVTFKKYIKDTFEDEIADVFIRAADLCGYLNIDIAEHIMLKLKYNNTRPYLHGKKF